MNVLYVIIIYNTEEVIIIMFSRLFIVCVCVCANNTRRRKTQVSILYSRVYIGRRKSHDFTPIFPEV